MGKKLVIYGASGHGKVVADAALAAGWNVSGWADDDPGKRNQHLADLPVLAIGTLEVVRYVLEHDQLIVVAIGRNSSRHSVCEKLEKAGASFATVTHPAAVVSPTASMGAGTVVMAGAIINPDTCVGRNAIVNTSASIDHDNRLGDCVHVCPGARLGGSVEVGEGTHVGIGATVRNNISIGSWSVIGAGAVVVQDIPPSVVAYGIPARVVGDATDSTV